MMLRTSKPSSGVVRSVETISVRFFVLLVCVRMCGNGAMNQPPPAYALVPCMLQAHLILQNFEDAIEAFQKVLSIEPSNKAAQNQVVLTRNKIKLSREKEKQRYANMFDKMAGKRGQEAAK